MKQRLYFECTSGHYSSGTGLCTFDHTLPSNPIPDELLEDGHFYKLSDLAGLGLASVSEVVLIDFGDPSAAFEAMMPLGYLDPALHGAVRTRNANFPRGFVRADGDGPVLYFRCSGGHYFADHERCPMDARSHADMAHAINVFRTACRAGEVPRPSEIVPKNSDLLQRTIVAQFGNREHAMMGIAPMIYRHSGATLLADNVPKELW